MLKQAKKQSSLTLFSPAKINLFFRVLAKRSDGYHEIATQIQALDFGDTIEFSPASADSLSCSDPNIPTDARNLIAKALAQFRKATGAQVYFHVNLQKNISTEAGLGGGSSNAATTLFAANYFSNMNLSDRELQEIGAKVGADVPFFFSQGNALCSGFGEIVKNLPEEEGFVWLVKPKEALSTPQVFSRIEPKVGENVLYQNDLEESAFAFVPRLQEIKHALLQMGFAHVWMTGSGTTIVCKGNGQIEPIPNCTIVRANFLGRKNKTWYAFEGKELESIACTQRSTMTN